LDVLSGNPTIIQCCRLSRHADGFVGKLGTREKLPGNPANLLGFLAIRGTFFISDALPECDSWFQHNQNWSACSGGNFFAAKKPKKWTKFVCLFGECHLHFSM
jgi:hypothetical protein